MGTGTQEFVKTEPHPYLRKLCLACRLEEILEFSGLLVQRPRQCAWLPPAAGPALMLTRSLAPTFSRSLFCHISRRSFPLAARLCILRIPRSLKRKLHVLRRVHHDDWADDVWNFVCADFVKNSVCGGQGCWLSGGALE